MLEKIYLGNTIFDEEQIKKIIYLQKPYWSGKSYHPFYKNCNHFTEFFSKKLLLENVNYPQYVNRLTKYGMFLSCFYEPLKKRL